MRSNIHWPSIAAVAIGLIGVGYAYTRGVELPLVVAITALGVIVAILASADKR